MTTGKVSELRYLGTCQYLVPRPSLNALLVFPDKYSCMQAQPPFLTRFSVSLNGIQGTSKIHGCLGEGPESKT